jgi:Zn-dependent protease
MSADPAADRPPTRRPDTGRGLRLGALLGVPVYVRLSWLVLAVIVVVWYGPVARGMVPGLTGAGGYALALGFVLSLLLSVLLHELGHAAMARRYGIGVRAITLELLGGYTEMESDSPHARADLLVSLIGPAVSGALGLAALGLREVLPDGTVADQLAFQLAWSNLIVAAFNALPGLPLDGGRALRAAVWAISGDRHIGTRVAGWIGRGVALATFGLGLLLAWSGRLSLVSVAFTVLVALTLWQGASAAILQGRLASRVPRVNLRTLARPLFLVGSGTPLAEAARRAAEAGQPDAALAVSDTSGRVVALVHDQAAAAVPLERRPWVPVDSVARTLDPGRTLAADLAGEDVIRAVQANPAPTYLVVSGEDVVGVLRTTDLARLLNS